MHTSSPLRRGFRRVTVAQPPCRGKGGKGSAGWAKGATIVTWKSKGGEARRGASRNTGPRARGGSYIGRHLLFLHARDRSDGLFET